MGFLFFFTHEIRRGSLQPSIPKPAFFGFAQLGAFLFRETDSAEVCEVTLRAITKSANTGISSMTVSGRGREVIEGSLKLNNTLKYTTWSVEAPTPQTFPPPDGAGTVDYSGVGMLIVTSVI